MESMSKKEKLMTALIASMIIVVGSVGLTWTLSKWYGIMVVAAIVLVWYISDLYGIEDGRSRK